jgi:parallel beta-helix repeat protein
LGVVDTTIANNTCLSNYDDGVLVGYTTGDPGCQRCLVSSCRCFANGGIGVAVFESSEIAVTSNICVDNQTDGIRVQNSPDSTVTGNQVISNDDWGILITGSSTSDCTVSGNIAKNNVVQGIRVNTSVTRTVVLSNRATFNGGISDNADFTNGSTTVTNADTTGFSAGDPVILDDSQIGTVSSVTSATEWELSAAYSGTTGSYDYRVLDNISADNFTDSGTNTLYQTATDSDPLNDFN